MNKIIFTEKSLEEYMYWQTQDRKTLKKINILIKDINRNPFEGIGKPERLKGDLGNKKYYDRLVKSKEQLESGKYVISKTLEELRELENE